MQRRKAAAEARSVPTPAAAALAQRASQLDESELVALASSCASDAEAQRLLGRTFAERGRLDHARAAFEQALRVNAEDAEALCGLGNVARLQGRWTEAQACYRSALAKEPDSAAARVNLALLEQQMGRTEDAIATLRAALGPPAIHEAVLALTEILLELGQTSEAMSLCEQVLEHEPAHAAGQELLRALLMRGAMEPNHGRALVERAIASGSGDAETLLNRALCAEYEGRFDDALACYDAAVSRHPEDARLRFHRSLAWLARRDFERGWPEYELRLQSLVRTVAPIDRPRWDGSPIGQGTLLVYGEQGIGDEIMFASCLPDVLAVCPRVMLACAPKLEPIFRTSFPDATVMTHDAVRAAESRGRLGDVAAMVPIGSLPRLFRNHPAQFPAHAGYLKADEGMIAEYRQRFGSLGPQPTVGFSWRGGTTQSRQSARSLPPAAVADLLALPGVRFLNLQYDSDGGEPEIAAAVKSGRLVHWPDMLADYQRTAAAVAAVDLVVSICTAVVHLAGALGKPAVVMTPFVAEWRYGIEGNGMCWYPSVRLVRQERPGDWSSVVRVVQQTIRQRVRAP